MSDLPEDFDAAIREIRRHLSDPKWLNAHEEAIYERLYGEGIKPHRVQEIGNLLEELLKHFLYQPTHSAWEELTEELVQVVAFGNVSEHLGPTAHVRAKYLQSIRQMQQASQELLQAKIITEHEGQTAKLIEIHLEILRFSVYNWTSNGLQTHTSYDELLAYVIQATNPLARVIILRALASYHLQNEDYAEGLYLISDAFQDLLNLVHYDLGKYDGRLHPSTQNHAINVLLTMGLLFRHDNEPDMARNCLKLALDYAKSSHHIYQRSFILHELGWICFHNGEPEDAVSLLSEAKINFDRIGHLDAVTQTDHSLGIILTELQNYSRALALLEAALEGYKNMNDIAHIVDTLHAIGYLHMQKKDWKIALKYLQKALEITYRMDDTPRRQGFRDRINEDLVRCRQQVL